MIFASLTAQFVSLLDVITGSDVTEAVTNATEVVTNAAAQAPPPDPGAETTGLIANAVIWIGFIAVIFIFMFWQPRKQQKAKDAMRNSLKVGDSVLTSSGFYGKIADIGTDVFVLEFGDNRGIRVPVRKEAVEGIREPNAK